MVEGSAHTTLLHYTKLQQLKQIKTLMKKNDPQKLPSWTELSDRDRLSPHALWNNEPDHEDDKTPSLFLPILVVQVTVAPWFRVKR